MHGEVRKERGESRVVASGNPDEIGMPLALRHAETIGAHALADALGVDRKAVSMSGIVGRKVRISYRTTGRRWQINVPAIKAKRIGCLASDGHGSVYFRRLPQPDEAQIIRRWIGLKPVESTSSPEATEHLRKKAVNAYVYH